ncbi:hypothetical protein KIL84_004342 [Mauremys mutica]|uniref:Uncharacterized protein n=1 Tax=Mauremys mutica TaxID=74926 RepID=A0A9D4B732_9SAUR|nr:hypothetical protein KIL84_004342 [Mauremys mutica]
MCHPWWQPREPACARGPATCTGGNGLGDPHSIGEPLLESPQCGVHSGCNPLATFLPCPQTSPPSRDDPCLLILGGTTPEQLESHAPPGSPHPHKAAIPLCSFQLFILPLPCPVPCSAACKEEAQPHHVTEQSGGHVTPTCPLPHITSASKAQCRSPQLCRLRTIPLVPAKTYLLIKLLIHSIPVASFQMPFTIKVNGLGLVPCQMLLLTRNG